LTKLGDAPAEFKAFLSGKVTLKGETIKENLPHSQSSCTIQHIPANL